MNVLHWPLLPACKIRFHKTILGEDGRRHEDVELVGDVLAVRQISFIIHGQVTAAAAEVVNAAVNGGAALRTCGVHARQWTREVTKVGIWGKGNLAPRVSEGATTSYATNRGNEAIGAEKIKLRVTRGPLMQKRPCPLAAGSCHRLQHPVHTIYLQQVDLPTRSCSP